MKTMCDILSLYNGLCSIYGNDNIAMTGSAAVWVLCQHFGIEPGFIPGDCDFIVIGEKEIRSSNLFGYNRIQSTHEQSATFMSDTDSFDLIAYLTLPSTLTLKVSGATVKFKSIKQLKRDYRDCIEDAFDSEKVRMARIKLSALDQMVVDDDVSYAPSRDMSAAKGNLFG